MSIIIIMYRKKMIHRSKDENKEIQIKYFKIYKIYLLLTFKNLPRVTIII